MKEFIFDECQRCINPNRIPIGNKEFYLEILTAFHDGKWYCGHWYWTYGHSFDWDVYLKTNAYDKEQDAIRCESENVSKFLKRYEYVPDFVFKELKALQTPQMTLF